MLNSVQMKSLKIPVKQEEKTSSPHPLPTTQKVSELSWLGNNRSSHWKCSVKKGVLKNFATFTKTRLCWSLFINKVPGLRPPTQVFSCEFCEIFKSTYFLEYLRTAAFETTSNKGCFKKNLEKFYFLNRIYRR